MVKMDERDNTSCKLSAKSTDSIRVKYKDLGTEYLYMSDASANWDEDNPTEDSGIVTPPAEIQFATDEEVQAAIQSIIDLYEEGGN